MLLHCSLPACLLSSVHDPLQPARLQAAPLVHTSKPHGTLPACHSHIELWPGGAQTRMACSHPVIIVQRLVRSQVSCSR